MLRMLCKYADNRYMIQQILSMYCVTYSSLLDKLREENTKTIPETIITIPVKIPQARYFRT